MYKMALCIATLLAGASAAEARDVTVATGSVVRVHGYTYVHPDCTVGDVPTVRILEPPQHGKVWLAPGATYPVNVGDLQTREACRTHRVAALILRYRAAAGYVGQDSVKTEVFWENGASRQDDFSITVK